MIHTKKIKNENKKTGAVYILYAKISLTFYFSHTHVLIKYIFVFMCTKVYKQLCVHWPNYSTLKKQKDSKKSIIK